METRIAVESRNVWGNELIYPTCPQGRLLARLVGRKTFTQRDVSILKELGYSVSQLTLTTF